MANFIVKILGSVLRSLFVTTILFLIAFSIITKEFPPNFSRLKGMSGNMQEMVKLSREIHERQKALRIRKEKNGNISAKEIEDLEELHIRRAELGVGFLHPNADLTSDKKPFPGGDLEEQVKVLQRQVLALQLRLDRMDKKDKEGSL